MKPKVYLETTIPSYLVAWPSSQLVTAARQQVTHEWWNNYRSEYELFVAESVLVESAAGDPEMARQRIALLAGIPELAETDETRELAELLMGRVPLPPKAAVDAMHVAVAAAHNMDYVLTWNFTHLANAKLKPAIEDVLRDAGYPVPTICTPEELMGGDTEDG